MSIKSQQDKANAIIGSTIGALFIASREGADKNRRAIFKCVCSCGKELLRSSQYLATATNPSCGCKGREAQVLSKLKHGQSRRSGSTKIYEVWKGIIARCSNPNNKAYKYYGGKGIKVSDEWLSFENFYADMGDPPFSTAQVDRIDSNGNYEKSNCRWLSQLENVRRAVSKK